MKAIQFRLGLRRLLGRRHSLDGFFHNVPRFDVLSFEEEDDSCRLRVDCGRNIENHFLYDFLNTSIGDRGVRSKLVKVLRVAMTPKNAFEAMMRDEFSDGDSSRFLLLDTMRSSKGARVDQSRI